MLYPDFHERYYKFKEKIKKIDIESCLEEQEIRSSNDPKNGVYYFPSGPNIVFVDNDLFLFKEMNQEYEKNSFPTGRIEYVYYHENNKRNKIREIYHPLEIISIQSFYNPITLIKFKDGIY